MKSKLAFALGVLLLALVAGMYLSGYLTLLLLKMPNQPLTFGTTGATSRRSTCRRSRRT